VIDRLAAPSTRGLEAHLPGFHGALFHAAAIAEPLDDVLVGHTGVGAEEEAVFLLSGLLADDE
jgi:hypothetical protein